MPRKAGGKAKTKRATSEQATLEGATSDAFTQDSYNNPNSSDQSDMGIQTGMVQQRGSGGPTRGVKKRRISNNYNCSAASNGIYGSGTIVASNPFDDDFPEPTNHIAKGQVLDNKIVNIPRQSPQNTISPAPHYSPGLPQPPPPPQQHHLHPSIQQVQHPQQPSLPHPHHMHQHQNQQQMYQQRGPSQPPVKHPDERVHQRNIRQPMTSTPYPPYDPAMSQIPTARQPVPSDMMPTMPPQPPLEPYTQPIDGTVMPAHSPYAANNPIGYCRRCQREIYQGEPSIICKASCKTYFHSSCSGLTPFAYELLMQESSAEWACDNCTSTDWQVPYVKYKH